MSDNSRIIGILDSNNLKGIILTALEEKEELDLFIEKKLGYNPNDVLLGKIRSDDIMMKNLVKLNEDLLEENECDNILVNKYKLKKYEKEESGSPFDFFKKIAIKMQPLRLFAILLLLALIIIVSILIFFEPINTDTGESVVNIMLTLITLIGSFLFGSATTTKQTQKVKKK